MGAEARGENPYPEGWKRRHSETREAVLRSSRALMHSKVCREFYKTAIAGHGPGALEKTESFVVLRGNDVVFEFFASGVGPETPQKLWSASKYVTALLVGAAVHDGRLRLDQRVEEFFPAAQYRPRSWDPTDYQKITIEDLLFMRSGFAWTEMDTSGGLRTLSVLWMLYANASKDMASFVLSRPIVPGANGLYAYSSGDYVVLMAILQKIYGITFDDFPWRALFDPLGIRSAVIEVDDQGTYVGGAYIYLSPADLARLAQLVRHDGVHEGRRVLPEGWISLLMRMNSGILRPDYPIEKIRDLHRAMGATTYLNRPVRGLPKPYPDLPDDLFLTIGLGGQATFVLPSQDLIMVRTGTDLKFGRKINQLGRLAIGCFAGPTGEAAEASQ